MATVTGVTNHWITAQEGFTTTLASTISSGATTVPLNSVSGYTNGDIVAFVIEPTDASKKQVFTGTIDTAGVQVTGVVWTEGTNQTHNAGVTVVDYWTATHQASAVKGLKVSHNQDGTFKTGAVSATSMLADAIVTRPKLASTFATEVKQGWLTGDLPAVSSATYNGNGSYDVTFASSVASILSRQMKLQFTRTVTAPTYMLTLNGTNQYATKVTPSGSLSTVTNNFSLVAWVYPTSYPAGNVAMHGRADATPNNGFELLMDTAGRAGIAIFNGGTANFRQVLTNQSLQLNKRQFVVLTWSSGTVTAYLNGTSIPVATATTGGTAPTTAGTGGDFSIGRLGAFNGHYFPGSVSGAQVYDKVLSAAEVKALYSQAASGAETNCIGSWSLNNTANDQNAAGNNLTLTNSPTYTSGLSPYATNDAGVSGGTTDVGLVMAVSGSTATVQVPEGCTIPTSGGVTSVAYSTTANPYGWVADKGRWKIVAKYNARTTKTSPTNATSYNNGDQITVPVGAFTVGYDVWLYQATGTAGIHSPRVDLNTTSATIATTSDFISGLYVNGVTEVGDNIRSENPLTLSAQTVYYLNVHASFGGTTSAISLLHDLASGEIYAIPAGI